jgi:hypothetical protein
MEILFTAFAIVAFLGTAICAAFAYRNAQECSEIEDGLRRHIGRIAANEAHCESLEAQLQKLRGKFYASQVKRDPDTIDALPPNDGLTDRERLRREHASDIMPAGVKRNGS